MSSLSIILSLLDCSLVYILLPPLPRPLLFPLHAPRGGRCSFFDCSRTWRRSSSISFCCGCLLEDGGSSSPLSWDLLFLFGFSLDSLVFFRSSESLLTVSRASCAFAFQLSRCVGCSSSLSFISFKLAEGCCCLSYCCGMMVDEDGD